MSKMQKEFNKFFKTPIPDKFSITESNEEAICDQMDKIESEQTELYHAFYKGDEYDTEFLHEMADVYISLMRLVYITGASGIFDDVVNRIHAANMLKEMRDGELVKPEGWKPADIKGLLEIENNE